jgi:dihydrofolate synthase/folylpolyglutamate synthase
MTYQQTLDYLFSQLPMFHRVGAAAYKADLTNTISLCEILGNPQHHFLSIHVAGTNGKGSVSHMMASILQESGLKVGLFTSPHLKDFRERIRINGKMIPKNVVTRFIESHKGDFSRISPSFFEMTAGLAFDHFSKNRVDIAVIEVGLGGRLDSTNVINPIVSVITNISFDHMQFLGDTLEKIAFEKAGIIKQQVPVVIGETHPQTEGLFKQVAESLQAPIVFADSIYRVTRWESDSPQRHEDTEGKSERVLQVSKFYRVSDSTGEVYPHIESPLLGNYQRKNIATVLAVRQALKQRRIPLDDKSILRGIKNVIRNTGFAGRWQVLSSNPLTICDTGHNESGLREVLEQIRQTPHHHLHFVFGVVNDKQIDHILTMLPREATYYFCKADIPRGMDAEELKQKAIQVGLLGESYPSVKRALEAASLKAGQDDLVFVGGSTFVVAEVV